ncbi:MAG TPA: GNAT family N-acetyltransferase [Candidatus Binatia bacterium]|nr:GNAT family N-acetyltransferase [Candidatus Binatia bacterium]
MNQDEISIHTVVELDRTAVIKLYQDAGWWRPGDETADNGAWIDTLVRQSFCFVGAFRNGELVGMGRAISDGISDAYIQDVVVLKEFRRAGIGNQIIEKIIEFLKERRIGWIGLIAEPGTQPFYRRLGFSPMTDHTPMLLTGQKD